MKKLFFLMLILSVFTLSYGESKAIPAFARQYSLSCQTCHSPAPRLKPYGDDFAGAGFTLSDKESPRYTQETGDAELSLIRNFPIAVRLDLMASLNNNDQGDFDLGTPYVIKILSGGSLAKNISYYFYFLFSERGEIAGVEDAYIMFNDLFDIDFDVYIGQFQISDPLFKRELRLTLDDYAIYKTRIGITHADLTYDRGLMFTLGLQTGTDIIVELINGNGIGEADGNKMFDNDKNKSFVGRISQDIGDFIRIGGFVYSGKQDLKTANLETTAEHLMFGPDLTFSIGEVLELNAQYLVRRDKNIIMAAEDTTQHNQIDSDGGFVEMILTPDGDKSEYYFATLFNHIESPDKSQKFTSATLHCGYLLRRNIRLFGEFSFINSNHAGEHAKFNLGIVSAF